MEITFIIILSYVVHVFLCRFLLWLAFIINREEFVKDLIPASFFPFIGLIMGIVAIIVEFTEDRSWFNGKNW
jgi:hypothetical protein